jgi:hypothetical protein
MITQGLLGIEKTVGSGPRSEMPAARGASRLLEENVSSLSFASLIDRLLSSGNGAGGGRDFEAAGARGPEGPGRSEKEKGGAAQSGTAKDAGERAVPLQRGANEGATSRSSVLNDGAVQGGEQRASEVKRGGREGKLWVPAAERRRGGTGASGAFEGAGKNANEISNGAGRHADRRIERGAKLFSHMAGIRANRVDQGAHSSAASGIRTSRVLHTIVPQPQVRSEKLKGPVPRPLPPHSEPGPALLPNPARKDKTGTAINGSAGPALTGKTKGPAKSDRSPVKPEPGIEARSVENRHEARKGEQAQASLRGHNPGVKYPAGQGTGQGPAGHGMGQGHPGQGHAGQGLADAAKSPVQQETRGGVSELVAASFKYEASSLKAAPRTDYQIHRNTDEIIGEIVKQFTLVARNGGGEARITLQPEFLGDLKLDLKLKGKEISTFILVENQAVKDLIVTKLNVLEQGLLQHGFSLGSFQVEVKDGGQGMKAAVQDGRKSRAGSTGSERGQETPGVEPLGYGLPWLSTVVNITV